MSSLLPLAPCVERVDLSRLSESQARLRLAVIKLGEDAFGSRWQTDLAATLSNEAGRLISQSQVSNWIGGKRPVPKSLVGPLRRLALRLADDLDRRAAEIAADWKSDCSESTMDDDVEERVTRIR